MITDDNKLIWGALVNERKNPDAGTYDAEGELPGPLAELDPNIEEESSGGCPNLDNLIGLAAASEDAEGVEDINIDDEAKSFKEIDEDTPL
tara:strand:+ start:1223 stop:1495 length:273 start_codon:yes stop_codon:yes gene_type:complete